MFKSLDTIGTYKRIAETLVACITALGLIPGGFYTFRQYTQEQQNQHIDKTLEFYKKQLDDKLLESRENLDVLYDSELRRKYLTSIKKKNDNEFIIERSKHESRHIMRLENFYEGVVTCTKKKICDEATAKALFKNDIQDFVATYRPFFCRLRKDEKDPIIAQDLVDFYREPHVKKPICPDTEKL